MAWSATNIWPTFVQRRPAAAIIAMFLMMTSSPATAKDVPYVPTPQEVVDKMLQMAEVKKGDYLIDLGSGDGRIVITAAQRYGATGFGVDIDPERIEESTQNARFARVDDKVKFIQADLFKTDISKADVLTMYLLPQVNLKLQPVILEKLRPGTRVVSHAFDMGEWKPDATANVEGRQVFRWTVPAKVSGSWRLDASGGGQTLNLRQTFQTVEGDLDGAKVSGRLDGPDLELVVDGSSGASKLKGRVEGDRIVGGSGWTAQRSGG